MTEQKFKQKKAWTKPEIRALVRKHDEEAVLAVCKDLGEGGGGPNKNFACQYTGHGNGGSPCIHAEYS